MRTPTVLLLVLISWVPEAVSEVVRQPAGLQPGDQYRLWFTTSETRNAQPSDIEDYNTFVQSVADRAPVVGSWGLTWKAVASTRRVDARDNTDTNRLVGEGVPIYRIDGQRFVKNYKYLWPIDVDTDQARIPLHITELGTTLSDLPPGLMGIPVWTGTTREGVASGPLPLGGNRALIGHAKGDSSFAFSASNLGRNQLAHVYAISDVLTAVPEPSSLTLLAFALCSLAFRCRR